MSMKWTDNQLKAIISSGSNILVSAAAGSGKTAVLVERVIKIITNPDKPVPADKLLIVTFTTAAAAEMKTRIYKALSRLINENPDNGFYRDQLDRLSQTQISTIHSFCQNLLKDNFYKIGISPDFSIIDEIVMGEAQADCARLSIEKGFSQDEDGMNNLLYCHGGRFDDTKLKNMIIDIHKYSMCKVNPKEWLDFCADTYSGKFSDTVVAEYIVDMINSELSDIQKYYDTAIDLSDLGGITSYYDFLTQEKQKFVFDKKLNWNELYDFGLNITFETMPRKTKDCDDRFADIVKECRKKIKNIVGGFANYVPFKSEDATKELNNQFGTVDLIRKLVLWYGEFYSDYKVSNNCYDFDDLLHLTLDKLLSNDEIAGELKNKYHEILIDEFQDTNEVNVAIFEKISKGNNLFMVGDVKQSIYGFLNALPDSFVNRYLSYKDEISPDGMKISLSNNFRSSENILSFINGIFEKIMTEKTGGVNYTDDQKLVYSNKKQVTDLPVEICVIDNPDRKTDYETEDYFIAKKIVTMVEVDKPLIVDSDTNELRPVKYSDIAILARSVKGDTATSIMRELSMFGISSVCEETESYLSAIEISTVLSFLQLIDNPYQDIPMLSVMRSPMFGFTDNELAEIKLEHKNCKFYNAVFLSKNPKAVEFVKTVNTFIKLSKTENLEFLINKIITDTGYYSFVGLLPAGQQRMANLRLLITRAAQFEKNERKSVFQYITYIKSMADGNGQYKSARDTSGFKNAVRIMTIHKSKGLEFPVVFLVRSGKGFGFKKQSNDVPAVTDGELGIGLNYVVPEKTFRYNSLPQNAILKKRLDKDMAEEMRVLYVALTRAKNYLCIIGSSSKAQDKLEKLSLMPVIEREIMSVGCFLDWIMQGVENHKLFKIISHEEALKPLNCYSSSFDDKYKDNTVCDEIDELLSYRYKHAVLSQIKSKMSVTEISGNDGVPFVKQFTVDKDKKFTKAQVGSLIHFVMSHIDYNNTSVDAINAQIQNMVADGLITDLQQKVVDVDRIYDFYNSPIGDRIKKSDKVYREYSFVVSINLKDIGFDNDEEILVQGTVDCFFYEDGDIVIVDYKTGNINEQYDRQIEIYKKCLEKLLGVKVKETILYKL